MERIMNAVRAQAAKQAALIANSRMGRVTSYDPAQYACKVLILPEGDFPDAGGSSDSGSSGWIPVQTIWSGPGWGVYSPPSIGDQVFVSHVEGDPGSGQIIGRVYDASHLPLAVQSGEFWMVHASGASFKFTNDGKTTVADKSGSSITMNGDGTGVLAFAEGLTINGNFTLNGNAQINGATHGTGEGTFNGVDVSAHTHTVTGVQTGSSTITTSSAHG